MVRYIARPPAALRGTRPSQALVLVKPSASDATAARAPDICSDCRASVSSARHAVQSCHHPTIRAAALLLMHAAASAAGQPKSAQRDFRALSEAATCTGGLAASI